MAFTCFPAHWTRSSSKGLSSSVRFRFRPTAGKGMGSRDQAPSQVASSKKASSASREAEMEGA